MTPPAAADAPTSVLIAGGGFGALETVLALRALAGERVSITLLAPNDELYYRPLSVREPFSEGPAQRYPLSRFVEDFELTWAKDSLRYVAPESSSLGTTGGEQLGYDTLVLAVGAARYEQHFHGAAIFDDARADEVLRGLIQDVDEGYARSIAFVMPLGKTWPLPLYELALMTASRAQAANRDDMKLYLFTPERAPLDSFGPEASDAVAEMLEQAGITFFTSSEPQVGPGQVAPRPGAGPGQTVQVQRIVSLPELRGPDVRGLPIDHEGFIEVDDSFAVRGLDRVYAAGDACSFPVKQGGLAAQQADTIANTIARSAGADHPPTPRQLEIRGILLTGGRPRYLTAKLIGQSGFRSEIADECPWPDASKVQAPYLSPYLSALDQAREAGRDKPADPIGRYWGPP